MVPVWKRPAAIVDLKMPGASGLRLVQRLHQAEPSTRIVVLTGYASVATAVEADETRRKLAKRPVRD